MNATAVEIPARKGRAVHVARGQYIEVINTHGEQVVDTWAFNRDELGEFMSMEHTRAHTLRLVPRVGDILRTNRRRPIITLVEDTSGGVHDTLIAACDRYRYAFLGVDGHHDNCADNLMAGLAELSLTSLHVPNPLNLFMNIPWGQDGGLSFAASRKPLPGGYVTLRAEMGLVIASRHVSGCLADQWPGLPAGGSALQDCLRAGNGLLTVFDRVSAMSKPGESAGRQ
jgi:uncharacterized protein